MVDSEGLKSGDQVIVSGLQKARRESRLKPLPIPPQILHRSKASDMANFFIRRPIFAWVLAII